MFTVKNLILEQITFYFLIHLKLYLPYEIYVLSFNAKNIISYQTLDRILFQNVACHFAITSHPH